MSELYRCSFDPLPDITAYELALCISVVGPSHIIAARDFERLGSTLRHYRLEYHFERGYHTVPMDEVAAARLALSPTKETEHE